MLALCIMVIMGKAYRAKNGSITSVQDTETAVLSIEIAEAMAKHIGVTKRKPITALLYKGDQFDRGEQISRAALDGDLNVFTSL
jgi:hypothetical protein